MASADREAYMHFAGDCLRKAGSETEPSRRRLLVVIAVAWVRLAERARTQMRNKALAG